MEEIEKGWGKEKERENFCKFLEKEKLIKWWFVEINKKGEGEKAWNREKEREGKFCKFLD